MEMPAAASFKHVSPAGTALGLPLAEDEIKTYGVKVAPLSPLTCDLCLYPGPARGAEREEWLKGLQHVTIGSDAFFPTKYANSTSQPRFSLKRVW